MEAFAEAEDLQLLLKQEEAEDVIDSSIERLLGLLVDTVGFAERLIQLFHESSMGEDSLCPAQCLRRCMQHVERVGPRRVRLPGNKLFPSAHEAASECCRLIFLVHGLWVCMDPARNFNDLMCLLHGLNPRISMQQRRDIERRILSEQNALTRAAREARDEGRAPRIALNEDQRKLLQYLQKASGVRVLLSELVRHVGRSRRQVQLMIAALRKTGMVAPPDGTRGYSLTNFGEDQLR